jgi:hypothetical protein
MVGVSLRQKPLNATEQNAPVAVRPVSGTPMWARNDLAPGVPRPASPWDAWTIPPKPAAITETRRPSPRPSRTTEPPALASAPTEEFRPWRIDFTRPDVVEYPERPEPPAVAPPEPATGTRRLLLLLGLAYLFLAALTSGLAYSGYFTAFDGKDRGDGEEPANGAPPPRPPARHPDAPGLHTRPDGSRYLVMPLPGELTERLRNRDAANAVHAAPATGGAAL